MYSILCSYGKVYIIQIGRLVSTRIHEHARHTKIAQKTLQWKIILTQPTTGVYIFYTIYIPTIVQTGDG